MISSSLKLITCLFVACLIVQAQTPAQKTESGSISGKVTLKGSGVAGIVVGAHKMESGFQPKVLVTRTDQDGKYRLSNVAPGQYEVMLAAPLFVVAGRDPTKRLLIAEGESVENMDFALVRGGVITGKVVDADGRPVIEEPIEVLREAGVNTITSTGRPSATDDRGIYRIYGLAPGKYRVAAGTSEGRLDFGRSGRAAYSQTFHPSTTESADATVIEVAEGSEVTNVDIALRRVQSVFTVTARIVDAETGQPIPNATYGLQKFREDGSSASSGLPSNALGEIKIENVTPGKYAIFIDPSPLRDSYAEPVGFEVVDQDVKDLVIKASTGGSVSGVVVLEGVEEKLAQSPIGDLMTSVLVVRRESEFAGTSPSIKVNPDGSFKIGGLRPGTLIFSVWRERQRPTTEFDVARIERDGVVQRNLAIKAGEQIKGLRLVLRQRSGRIRGLVKFENKPSNSVVHGNLRRVGDENFGISLELDARGQFITEALMAGVYEVTVIGYRERGRPASATQQVVVADNQVSELVLTLDFKNR